MTPLLRAPESAGMWLRHSPLPSAHLLRVLLWGKEVGKGQGFHSELVTKQKVAEMEVWTGKDTHQRPHEAGNQFQSSLERLGGWLMGNTGRWVESCAFGPLSLALAHAPLPQRLVSNLSSLAARPGLPTRAQSRKQHLCLGDCFKSTWK